MTFTSKLLRKSSAGTFCSRCGRASLPRRYYKDVDWWNIFQHRVHLILVRQLSRTVALHTFGSQLSDHGFSVSDVTTVKHKVAAILTQSQTTCLPIPRLAPVTSAISRVYQLSSSIDPSINTIFGQAVISRLRLCDSSLNNVAAHLAVCVKAHVCPRQTRLAHVWACGCQHVVLINADLFCFNIHFNTHVTHLPVGNTGRL